VVPAGAETLSDPVALTTGPGQDLAVSLHTSGTVPAPTTHALALTTSYTASGDHTADTGATAFTGTTTAWTFLDGVDVHSACPADSVVALGDSLTDGVHSTPDANASWPAGLARRLDARPGCRTGVLNEGINANRLLTDNTTQPDTGQARFDRDVLAQTGVHTVILLEGINDIGHDLSATGDPVTAGDVTDAYQALIRSAHSHGVRVIGATLLPIGGSKYDTPAAEQVRTEVNTWIRTSGAFDGVADFDETVRDPADPSRLLPAYDSGDDLHPDDAGYRAMADTVDLNLIHP
jgi:lysophospholipase L1-like esterase